MRFKKGHIRNDGMVFWSYACQKQGGRENWVTAEKFQEKTQISKRAGEKYRASDKGKARAKPVASEKAKADAKARKKTEKWKAYTRKYWAQRRKDDPILAMSIRLRTRLKWALKGKGWQKKNNTRTIIGCSFEDLLIHIESLFKDNMSWDNRHLWEIDHIKPLSKAKTYDELVELSHYTNLQPLWTPDNRKKSNKC